MTKEEVRAHAARLKLRVAEKAESQDICFVPDGDYVRFLEEQRGAGLMDGELVHVDGRVLGGHQGTYRYTTGQRRGLGIAWPEPLFVVGIDAAAKRVIVGEKRYLAVADFSVRRSTGLSRRRSARLMRPAASAIVIRKFHRKSDMLTAIRDSYLK